MPSCSVSESGYEFAKAQAFMARHETLLDEEAMFEPSA
jgi:hypothetical protein